MGVAATFKPMLHPRQREDGTQQVRVRVTKDRKSVYLDMGFTLSPKHWNPKANNANWVRGTEPDAAALNAEIAKAVHGGRVTSVAHPNLGAAEVRDLLLAERGVVKPEPAPALVSATGVPLDVVGFAAYYVRERGRTTKYGTMRFYARVAADLASWLGEQVLLLTELTEERLLDFHDHLLAKPNVFAGTARDRLVKWSTIMRRAQRLGLVTEAQNPFTHFELPANPGNKRPPRRPTDAERAAILAFDLNLVPNVTRRKGHANNLAKRRDMWHLQYLLMGSRIGDVLRLRERDVRPDRITFSETKTGKLKSVARTPAINEILARYPATGEPLAFVFGVLDHRKPWGAEHPAPEHAAFLDEYMHSRIAWVNKGLQLIAKAAGVPHFTSHSARHMYADRAYSKLKDLRTVQAMLNHSSPAVTEQYLQTLGFGALDEAAARVLSD